MQYEIRRSKRKSLSISVRNAKVTVNAPMRISEKSIERFVRSKMGWIEIHLKSQAEQKKQKNDFAPDYGSDILYLGELLRIEPTETKNVRMENNMLLIPADLNSNHLKRVLIDFYKKEAGRIIREKVIYFSSLMDVQATAVRITSARTRWGSCNSNGNVNFSWYLVMAPEDKIDYVVVHELAHMLEMNHSRRFWAIVEKYIPDRKQKRKTLKELNQRLLTENWEVN